MRGRGISRRTLLQGMCGGAAVGVGLPALEIFLNSSGDAYADGSGGLPRRFGLFFWGNGMLPDRWTPSGEGDSWQLSDQLAPLAAFKEHLTVVTGTRLGIPNTVPHHAGAAGILTGSPVVDPYGDETFAGPSIDQIVAARVGAETRFRSLEFGAEPGRGLSHNGPNSVNPPEASPLALFERVFGGSFTLPGEEPILDPTLALRRSVLDTLLADMTLLKASVGAADKARLEQHFEAVRSLEQRLARLEEDPPNLAACALPNLPAAEYPDIAGRPQLQEQNRAFCDVVAMAMACDQTRVFSNFFTHPLTNRLFRGISAGHHQLTHDEPGDQPEVHAITVQCMEAMAYQIEALQAVEEGDGTLLNSCVVLGTSEVSLGKTHSLEEFPIVLAGGCGGRLKTNLHYRSPAGENTSKVLLSLCRAMGLDMTEFGREGGRVEESLGAIEV